MKIAISFEISLSAVLAVVLLLAAAVRFGVWYDRKVEAWQAQGSGEFTSWYVAIGCGVTVVLIALISTVLLNDVGFGLATFGVQGAAFAATGLPMMFGSVRRHRERLAHEADREREIIEDELNAAA